jgi:hypothetical protein
VTLDDRAGAQERARLPLGKAVKVVNQRSQPLAARFTTALYRLVWSEGCW